MRIERLLSACLTCVVLLGAARLASADDAALAQQLQEHADRVAINATLVQYTEGLDRVDADLYAGAFTPDAKFYRGESPEKAQIMAEGTAQIRKIITDLAASDARAKATREAEWKGEGSPPARIRHHVMTNEVVEFVDDHTATHRAYWMTVSGSGREMNVVAQGSYQDTLVKVGGHWSIKERYLLAR
jgi:SnoaL-like domain